MNAARIIYAGTPEFALPPLQRLHAAGVEIAAVYTQPDRPAGRGRKLTASPVKQWAQRQGLPVEQPENLRGPGAEERLLAFSPDLVIVTAYGLILPPAILGIPRLGCVNLHASLLPHWRGAAPVQRAIQAGDPETGVTLMQMDAGLDTGDMLVKKNLTINPGETAGELQSRIAQLAADVLVEYLPALLDGRLPGEQQRHELATYAHKIKKEEAWLDWGQNADRLAQQVAAFNPWPVAQTRWRERVLRIGRASAMHTVLENGAKPGQVIAAAHEGIDVACGSGILRVLELQLPGARMMNSNDFLNAHSINGELLE